MNDEALERSKGYKDAAINFLEHDFNQCFEQMRHYDSQLFGILKFVFTSYTALIGVALSLYQYGAKKQIDLSPPAIACLTVGFIFGAFMYALIIRNRVYFVHVTRYINEQRKTFLDFKPLGFENKSKMYTNFQQPPFFNWRSSQSWFFYILAFFNSTIIGGIFFILLESITHKWKVVLFVSVLIFVVQLLVGIIYLITRENKTASKSVFGKE